MHKIKREDRVVVLVGRERGKQGQVRQVLARENRVIVSGVNMVKRHQRPRTETTPAGIIEKEAPLQLSNVMVVCKSCNRPTRTSIRQRSDGTKIRVCKRCKADID